mgnify:CR=1 FL=1
MRVPGGRPGELDGAGGLASTGVRRGGGTWAQLSVACAVAVWYVRKDGAYGKAAFSEDAEIFKRKHNWIMCWLYLGAFGSFIG